MSVALERLKLNLLAVADADPALYATLSSVKLPDDEFFPSFEKFFIAEEWLKNGKNQVDKFDIHYAKLLLILGFGTGAEIQYAMDIAKDISLEYLLVVERNAESIILAFTLHDFTTIIKDKRIKILVGLEQEAMFPWMINYAGEFGKYLYTRASSAIFNESVLMSSGFYYLDALQAYNQSFEFKLREYVCSPFDSLTGIENMLSNIDTIVKNPGINLLKDKFKGKPAIVVSTGPSLDKNKHLLKEVGDKALIISADSAWGILEALGVKPHIVTALERGVSMTDLFEDLKPESYKDVFFAACPVVDKNVYDLVKSDRIIVFRNFDHFKWLGVDRGILKIYFSVGNMSFAIAKYLGCDPIILIGQDLSRPIGGADHALGMFTTIDGVNPDSKAQFDAEQIPVPGNIEKFVYTTSEWINGIRAYEYDVKTCDATVINSTEGGALIKGTLIMPFKDSIAKYLKDSFDSVKIIRENLAMFVCEDQAMTQIKKLIDTTLSDIEDIKEASETGIKKVEILKSQYKEEFKNTFRANGVVYEAYVEPTQFLDSCVENVYRPASTFIRKNNTYQLLLMHVLQAFVVPFKVGIYGMPLEIKSKPLAKILAASNYDVYYKNTIKYSDMVADLLVRCKKMLKTGKYERSDNSYEFNGIKK